MGTNLTTGWGGHLASGTRHQGAPNIKLVFVRWGCSGTGGATDATHGHARALIVNPVLLGGQYLNNNSKGAKTCDVNLPMPREQKQTGAKHKGAKKHVM